MMKSFRECLDSIFWVFPTGFILMDQPIYLLFLLGSALYLVYVFLMLLLWVLLDAIIGYKNVGEYDSNEGDYEYLIAEYAEKHY